MPSTIHGTKNRRGRQHPVLDINRWEAMCPLGDQRDDGGWVDTPRKLALREQSCRLAQYKGRLGPSVQTDVFVWADSCIRDRPWLTKIGGTPWRAKGKPWPKGDDGIPLVFLGQICFADSRDLVPFELPGDVALIFGSSHRGWVSLSNGFALEWSPLELKKPEDGLGSMPWNGELPFEYQGVIHRTKQFTDANVAEGPFQEAGWGDGGWRVSSMQATSIGQHASIPQGWPFEPGDGNTLVACLSSFYFRGQWPLCDVPSPPKRVRPDGSEAGFWNDDAVSFSVGDAGTIWIYRDRRGKFRLDEACG